MNNKVKLVNLNPQEKGYDFFVFVSFLAQNFTNNFIACMDKQMVK